MITSFSPICTPASQAGFSSDLRRSNPPQARQGKTRFHKISTDPARQSHSASHGGPEALGAGPTTNKEKNVKRPSDLFPQLRGRAGADERIEAAAASGVSSTTETKRRDDTIEAAVRAGKVRSGEHESLCGLHARSRDVFYSLLTAPVEQGGLAPGLVTAREAPGEPSAGGLDAALASFGLRKGA